MYNVILKYLIYSYIYITYGYALFLLGKTEAELELKIHNKKDYNMAVFVNLIITLLYPILLPLMILGDFVHLFSKED